MVTVVMILAVLLLAAAAALAWFLVNARIRFADQQAEARGDLSQLVGPLNDALRRVESGMAGMEAARQNAYGGLSAQVRGLLETNERLRLETANLAGALRSPQARGRWGEVQLRRVVEMAGMVPHCDFVEQQTVVRAGVTRRPDLIVRLPGDRRLAVDAKVPLAAYLQAHETDDDDRRRMLLREHARAVRTHVNALADKAYWEQFADAPDFVVLFIPGEPFLAAAYEYAPELFEYAHGRRVLLATPTTLIALLQSVALGWRQESVAEDAQAVCELGRVLYQRLSTMGEHVTAVGRALDKAVDAYNHQVASLESRVMVTARRLATFEPGAEARSLEPIERAARRLQAAEFDPSFDPPALERSDLDAPGLESPGLDHSGPERPELDAPGLDAPGLHPAGPDSAGPHSARLDPADVDLPALRSRAPGRRPARASFDFADLDGPVGADTTSTDEFGAPQPPASEPDAPDPLFSVDLRPVARLDPPLGDDEVA